MSSADVTPGFQIRGWHVLAMIVGFFAVVIGVNVVFTVMALRTFPREVSVTPYEDGLLYNKKLAQLSAQDRLGWRAAAGVGDAGEVVVEIRDRADKAVSGLSIQAKMERPATEAGRLTPRFQELAPGRYVAEPGRLAGSWDLTFTAHDRDGHSFEAERRLTW